MPCASRSALIVVEVALGAMDHFEFSLEESMGFFPGTAFSELIVFFSPMRRRAAHPCIKTKRKFTTSRVNCLSVDRIGYVSLQLDDHVTFASLL